MAGSRKTGLRTKTMRIPADHDPFHSTSEFGLSIIPVPGITGSGSEDHPQIM